MAPIEKNIIVIDQNGTQYEPTYPKRAKGLVKNGRARFVDEHMICLACPPVKKLEDKEMEVNDKNTNTNDAITKAIDMLRKACNSDKISAERIPYLCQLLHDLTLGFMDYNVKSPISKAVLVLISDKDIDSKERSHQLAMLEGILHTMNEKNSDEEDEE